MITTATTPLHPDDRMAMWTHKRSAYVNNEPAANPFQVRPVTKINLATPDGQPHRKRGNDFPQRRKQKWLTALAVIGNTLGGLLLFCAAFWFVTMLSYALHSAGVL